MTIDTITHLLSALIPSISVLVFLLLHRRQSIQADLEDRRLRQSHHESLCADQTARTQALAHAAHAFAPAAMELVQRVVPGKPEVTELSDEDLVAELDRRISENDWKHGNPFAALDELLERLWSGGGDVPQPRTAPPAQSPIAPLFTKPSADVS